MTIYKSVFTAVFIVFSHATLAHADVEEIPKVEFLADGNDDAWTTPWHYPVLETLGFSTWSPPEGRRGCQTGSKIYTVPSGTICDPDNVDAQDRN